MPPFCPLCLQKALVAPSYFQETVVAYEGVSYKRALVLLVLFGPGSRPHDPAALWYPAVVLYIGDFLSQQYRDFGAHLLGNQAYKYMKPKAF